VTTPLRQLRLTRTTDIRSVFGGGKRVNDPHMRLIFRCNGRQHPRFCIQVGRKISKKAVVRNRIRRRAREVFQAQFGDSAIGVDVVVLAQRSVATMPWHDLVSRGRHLATRIPGMEAGE